MQISLKSKFAIFNRFKVPALYSLTSSLNAVISIGLGPLILSKVGLGFIGYLGLAYTVNNIFMAMVDFGFSTHLISRFSNKDEFVKRDVSNTLYLRFLFSGLSISVYGLYYFFYDHPLETKLISSILIIPTLMSSIGIGWYFIAMEKFKLIIYSNIIQIVVYVSMIILWYNTLESNYWVPVIVTVSQIIAIIFQLIVSKFWEKLTALSRINFKIINNILLKVLPLALVAFTSPFYLQSGILLLNASNGSSFDLGCYGIAQKIIMGWIVLLAAMVYYLIPKIKVGYTFKFFKVFNILLLLTISVYVLGVAVIAYYTLQSGVGYDVFIKSSKIFSILIFGLFFMVNRVQYVSFLIRRERYKFYAISHMICVIPIIYLLIFPFSKISIYHAALLACIPDIFVTIIIVIYCNNLVRKELNNI